MASAAPASAGSWDSLKLSPAVLEIVKTKLGFSTMTPVQAHTISPFLSYKDVAVEAPTGSGKTLAFVIPMFEMLMRRKDPLQAREIGAIIISPTRELATQISHVVEPFASALKFTSLLVIGGTGIQEAQILIGTPGRMLYFLQEVSDLKLRELEVLILDEADRLLDLGFEVTLNSILTKLPKQRRTGLFSATQTKEVEELVRAGLRNPMYIQVKVENKLTSAPQKIPATLQNFVMKVTSSEKLPLLVQFLLTHPNKKFIVYFLTCACVDYFWMILSQLPELKNIKLSSLHGKVPHTKRSAIFQRFVNTSHEQGAVLMTTDVAARGLDLPDVDWIIQYDLPQDPQMYVHRIGRTARMGREGSAVAYLTPQEDAYTAFLKKALEVPVEEMPKPDVSPLLDRVRAMACKDYMLVKKSHIAFVSYMRAYREHKCSYLLPWKLLDFGELANGFCLLKLPRMPELQGKETSAFKPVAIELSSIPCKDPIMEKQRRAKMAAQEARKLEEPQKPERKREAPAPKAAPVKQARREETDDSEDEKEILREYALMKKNKKRRAPRDEASDEVAEWGAEEDEQDHAGGAVNGESAEVAVEADSAVETAPNASAAIIDAGAASGAQLVLQAGLVEKEEASGAGIDAPAQGDKKKKKKRKFKKHALSIPLA